MRLDALDTKVDEISSHLTSNLTELATSLNTLESKINSSDATLVKERVDKLESDELPELKKMVRHSIKKGKENSLSIEELRKHDHSWRPPISQNTPNSFEMINTLMVQSYKELFSH